MDHAPKKCKFCGRTFRLDHILTRHEQSQCPNKPKPRDRSPENKKVVINARTLLSKQQQDLKKELAKGADPKAPNIVALKGNIDESKRMHDLTIELKNTNKAYSFHCSYCNEGFEFEREMINHMKLCIRKPSPAKIAITKKPTSTPTPASITKNTPSSDSLVLKLQEQVKQLQEESALQKREIEHIQQAYKQVRKDMLLVRNVEEQLQQLHDIKFQLRLFSTATLRQGQGPPPSDSNSNEHSSD